MARHGRRRDASSEENRSGVSGIGGSSFQLAKGHLGSFFFKAPNLDLIVGGESLNASEVKNIWSSDGEAEKSK